MHASIVSDKLHITQKSPNIAINSHISCKADAFIPHITLHAPNVRVRKSSV